MPSCSPPKSVSVRDYFRTKPRKSAKRAGAKRTANLPYVVRDTRSGRVVSRHRSLTAAIRVERRLDLQAYRAGRGRPYSAEKA